MRSWVRIPHRTWWGFFCDRSQPRISLTEAQWVGQATDPELWPIWGWLASKGMQVQGMGLAQVTLGYRFGGQSVWIQADYIRTKWQEVGLTALSSSPTTNTDLLCQPTYYTKCTCTALTLQLCRHVTPAVLHFTTSLSPFNASSLPFNAYPWPFIAFFCPSPPRRLTPPHWSLIPFRQRSTVFRHLEHVRVQPSINDRQLPMVRL